MQCVESGKEGKEEEQREGDPAHDPTGLAKGGWREEGVNTHSELQESMEAATETCEFLPLSSVPRVSNNCIARLSCEGKFSQIVHNIYIFSRYVVLDGQCHAPKTTQKMYTVEFRRIPFELSL